MAYAHKNVKNTTFQFILVLITARNWALVSTSWIQCASSTFQPLESLIHLHLLSVSFLFFSCSLTYRCQYLPHLSHTCPTCHTESSAICLQEYLVHSINYSAVIIRLSSFCRFFHNTSCNTRHSVLNKANYRTHNHRAITRTYYWYTSTAGSRFAIFLLWRFTFTTPVESDRALPTCGASLSQLKNAFST